MEKPESIRYHTHISANPKRFELKLKEVWRYRDLIVLFTKRTFMLTYKQTILGPAWIVLNPLISSLIYAFIFGGIAGIGTDGVPTLLFYLCSNAIWIYFSTCVTQNATTFTGNAAVFGKVYFPRLATPISNVLSSVIQFGIQMILVMIFMVFYLIKGQVHPNWAAWVLIPPVLIHLGVLGLSCGIVISSLTTKYRDLSILVTFGVQLWMYITPIVYPMSSVGEGLLQTIFMINPVTPAVELLRYALLGQGSVHWGYYALSVVLTVVLFLFGVMTFNRVEKTFMDTV
jgi:lipopolysaccharide transport system permease protein